MFFCSFSGTEKGWWLLTNNQRGSAFSVCVCMCMCLRSYVSYSIQSSDTKMCVLWMKRFAHTLPVAEKRGLHAMSSCVKLLRVALCVRANEHPKVISRGLHKYSIPFRAPRWEGEWMCVRDLRRAHNWFIMLGLSQFAPIWKSRAFLGWKWKWSGRDCVCDYETFNLQMHGIINQQLIHTFAICLISW